MDSEFRPAQHGAAEQEKNRAEGQRRDEAAVEGRRIARQWNRHLAASQAAESQDQQPDRRDRAQLAAGEAGQGAEPFEGAVDRTGNVPDVRDRYQFSPP